MSGYHFETPFPDGHFVREYCRYASERTDAAGEYHQAAALFLLACATPGVRARLAPYPQGLPTNLYLLLIGDSTVSRKSTAMAIAADVLTAAIPGAKLAEAASPEGFAEELAERPGDASAWIVDEFGELLHKLNNARHMAGLRGLLLTVYGGGDYTYRRHSKRVKGGGKVEDVDRIERPHLSILGAATPAVFDTLTEADMMTGLLPRFAIIMPDGKPPRRPFYELPAGVDAQRNRLVMWLRRIYEWARGGQRTVRFEPGALELLDDFAADIEQEAAEATNEAARTMLQRLTPMAVKIGILAAAGRTDALGGDELTVTVEDATAAAQVAAVWRFDAVRFAERVGQNEFEKHVQRCLRFVQERGPVPRRAVARAMHLPKRLLDEVEATLLDRGLITVATAPSPSGPPKVVWALARGVEEVAS